MKTDRRLGREFALQALFYREARNISGNQEFDDFWSMFERRQPAGPPLVPGGVDDGEPGLPDKPRQGVRQFAETLVLGTLRHRDDLDVLISASADNWRLDRMSSVDRNILRLAIFETIFHRPPTPPAVVIDEAVELAKRYGTADSGRFVNGILDHVLRDRIHRRDQESVTDDETV
jgi:N utilization substance protein B